MASSTNQSNPVPQAVTLEKPAPGQTVVVDIQPNQIVDVPFDMAEANITLVGKDLRLEFPGNAVLILTDFAAMVEAGTSPLMMFADGTVVAGDVILTALSAEVPETAAGPGGGSGGAGEYEDDMGAIIAGINKLGPQNPDPFAKTVELQLLDQQLAVPAAPLPVNNPPIAEDNVYRLTAGELRSILASEGIFSNDFDPDGDPIAFSGADNPPSVTINTADGSLTIDATTASELYAAYQALDDGETLSFTFPYTITDPGGLTATANVTIIVEGVNDPPVAVDNQYSVGENGILNTANIIADPGVDPDFASPTADFDPDVEPLTVYEVNGNPASVGEQITLASGALLTVNADGTFSYDPNGKFEGLDDGETATETFTYRVTDGDAQSNLATVTITINGANDAPVANADTNWIMEDAVVASSGNVLSDLAHPGAPSGTFADVADSDVDIEPLTVTLIDGNAVAAGTTSMNGTAVIGDYGTLKIGADGSYSYTIDNTKAAVQALDTGDAPLTDQFTYTVSDGTDARTATVTISIFGVNDPPTVTITPQGDENIVYEAGLIPDGSGIGPTATVSEGILKVGDPDGLDDIVSLTIAGTVMQIGAGAGQFASLAAMVGETFAGTGGYGTLELTAYANGEFTYQYTLSDKQTHTQPGNDLTLTDIFGVVVSDGTASANAQITVTVVDDRPFAANDYDGVTVDAFGNGSTIGDVQLNDIMGADGPQAGTSGAVTAVAFDGTTVAVVAGGSAVIQGTYGELTIHSDGTYSYTYNTPPEPTPEIVTVGNLGGATLTAFDNTSPFDGSDLNLSAIPDALVDIHGGGGANKQGFGVDGDKGPGTVDFGEYLVIQLADPIIGQFTFQIGEYNAGQSDLGDMTWAVYGVDGSLIDSGTFADLGGTQTANGTYTGDAIDFGQQVVAYIVFGMNDLHGQGYTVTNIEYIDLNYKTGIDDFVYTVTDTDGDTSSAHLYITSDQYLEANATGSVLTGGFGDDILLGLGGADTLIGGGGDDILAGGAGADTFAYSVNGGEGSDTITDFNASADILRFHDVLDGPDGDATVDLDDLVNVTFTKVDATTITLDIAGSDGATHITLQAEAGSDFNSINSLTDLNVQVDPNPHTI